MIVSIHQPGYLPWPGYFHRLAMSDVHVFFDDVQFEKHGLNNRNRIKTLQGSLWLTVPVRTRGRFGENPLNEVEIAEDRWRRRHWRSLCESYGRAAHFREHAPFLEDIYQKTWRRLLPLNITLIEYMLGVLGIKTKIVRASELGVSGEKSDRVLNICKSLNTTVYLSGNLGRNYLQVEKFCAAGIRVMFQDYRFPVYQQLHGEYVSNLSIVDLLFNYGAESRELLLSGNLTREHINALSPPIPRAGGLSGRFTDH